MWKQKSNLGGCLHPDVIWRRNDANVGPPEVIHEAEQYPGGPHHGVGKGWVIPNIIQLIANTTPRKQCLREDERKDEIDTLKQYFFIALM